MRKSHTVASLAAAALIAGAAFVMAPAGAQAQRSNMPIYGSQMMTPEERAAYQDQMRNATTEQERAKIRAEHHAAMQQRAKERGVTLPDDMPARGQGMGKGMGSGMGKGMGSGMGRKQ